MTPHFPVPLALSQRAAELWLAVPQVVALRTAQMMTPALTGSARRALAAEMHLMGSEKLAAAQEALWGLWMQSAQWQMQWALQVVQAWVSWPLRLATQAAPPRLAATPSLSQVQRAVHQSLGPVHRRATANVRRLRRAMRS